MRTQTAVMDIEMESPEEGEVIARSRFSFRIWAGDAKGVAIAIDGGAWRPCRAQAGYWWYDWARFGDGRHSAEAQMRSHDGNVRSIARLFWVERLDAQRGL